MTLVDVRFSTRACGHRVPIGDGGCVYCKPPRLSVQPLAELLRKRCDAFGTRHVAFEIAARLGMTFDTVERQVSRILSGRILKVSFHTADSYCVACGEMPTTLWGKEWDAASPVEPYGDEDF